jgi:hypothetical protein
VTIPLTGCRALTGGRADVPAPSRVTRRAFVGFVSALAGARIARADATDFSATVMLDGGTYRYAAGAGEDLGDFRAPGFTQVCIRVSRDDCPLVIYFRPDRTDNRAEVVFELGSLWRGAARTLGPYRVEIASGGTTLAKIEVPRHFWFSRWRWQSAERPVVADIDRLIADGLLPPYRHAGGKAKGRAVTFKGNAMPRGYAVMDLAGIEPHMGATGERPDIGLVTESQGRFICTGDHAALEVLRAQAEAAGTLPWHMRDEKTGAPVDLDAYPTMSWYPDGNVGKPHIAIPKTDIEIDAAHEPALAYLPYLLTGDPYHLEDLQFAATYNRGWFPPEYRLSIGQTRAFAWSMRTLAQVARVTPDMTPRWLLPRGYWQRDLDRTRNWFTQTFVDGQAPLQRVFRATDNPENSRDEGPATPGGTWIAPWMDEFLAAVFGWMVLMGHDAWKPAFEWKLGSTLARTDGKSGWQRGVATPYRLVLRPNKTAPYVTSWSEAWALNSRIQGWHLAFPDEIEAKDPTYFIYTRGVLALATRLGVSAAAPNLRWIDDQLHRHAAQIPYKWQIASTVI